MSVANAPTYEQLIDQIVERARRGETFSTRLAYDWVGEKDIEYIWRQLEAADGVEPLVNKMTQGGDTFYVFNPPH